MTPDAMRPDALAAQIVDELSAAAWRLVPLVGLDLWELLDERIRARAPMWAAVLRGDDEHERAELVQDLLIGIWGQADPPVEWWRTPLGLVCAASLGIDDDVPMSRADARKLLEVTTGTIDRLIAGGRLRRHPDGGLTRGSVLDYLLHRRPRGSGRQRLDDGEET